MKKTIMVKEGYEFAEKRFYLPAKFKFKCPECKSEMIDDLEEQYLSYPAVGETLDRYAHCNNCDVGYAYILEIESVQFNFKVGDELTKDE